MTRLRMLGEGAGLLGALVLLLAWGEVAQAVLG